MDYIRTWLFVYKKAMHNFHNTNMADYGGTEVLETKTENGGETCGQCVV